MDEIRPEGVGPLQEQSPEKSEGTITNNAAARRALAAATRLSDLEHEFVLFTPAMFFTVCELDKDPVQEFYNEVEGEPVLSVMSFDEAPFEGLVMKHGNPGWNHKILAIEKPYWERCLRFLGTVGILDRKRKTFARAMAHHVRVADVMALKNYPSLGEVPLVSVVAFGLDGNLGKYVLEGPKNPPLDKARVVKLKAEKSTVQYAWSLFHNKVPGEAGFDPEKDLRRRVPGKPR
jgi:hypothetical protein